VLFVQELVHRDAGSPDQGAGDRIVVRKPDGILSILTEGFAAAADPCLSFDAGRVLFAGKLTMADPWDIWEMEVDGSRKTRVTRGLGDCREPIYLPAAAVDSPDFKERVRWITFVSTAPEVGNDQGDGALTSLYALNLEPVPDRGTVLWRTAYDLGGERNPTLLSDGRVLFSARQRGTFALMAMSWAGENIDPLYEGRDRLVSLTEACELDDRTVLFIESDATPPDGGGRLASISLRRPLRSYRLLDRGHGRYRTPHALPGGGALVSYAEDTRSFGVYTFDPQRGERGRKICDDPAWNDVDPIPIVPRPAPPAHIPMVEFASVLDVGSLKGLGQLQCLNVYDSDRPDAGEVNSGEVKEVRLVEGVCVPFPRETQNPGWRNLMAGAGPDSTWPPPGVEIRILGQAPVEADGSFYVNVVGDLAFYVQTLDAQGRAVQTMRAWAWVRSGDQRGCVGCHADPELAPENRATQALRRALPVTLAAAPETRATSTFEKDVMPILERRCLGCHSSSASGGRLVLSDEVLSDKVLSDEVLADEVLPGKVLPEKALREKTAGPFNAAYVALLGRPAVGASGADEPYVRAGDARHSPLIDRLLGSSPHGGLTEEERRTIITWVDLGARWDGSTPATGMRMNPPPSPARK
jgi:hypothetical protein